jgi:hypothetical protein
MEKKSAYMRAGHGTNRALHDFVNAQAKPGGKEGK